MSTMRICTRAANRIYMKAVSPRLLGGTDMHVVARYVSRAQHKHRARYLVASLPQSPRRQQWRSFQQRRQQPRRPRRQPKSDRGPVTLGSRTPVPKESRVPVRARSKYKKERRVPLPARSQSMHLRRVPLAARGLTQEPRKVPVRARGTQPTSWTWRKVLHRNPGRLRQGRPDERGPRVAGLPLRRAPG